MNFDNKYLFLLIKEIMNYILQLNNGQTLEYPVKDVDFYPTIRDHAIDVGAEQGDTIILNYSDPEFLYKVFTTNYLTTNYNLDEFVRIANAVDFLGNDQILEQMMQKLVTWFNNSSFLTQFKANKTKVEDAMFNLGEGPIYWLLQNSSAPNMDYNLELKITTDRYDIAVSDDLSYMVIWAWDNVPIGIAPTADQIVPTMRYITIFKNGQRIKDMTDMVNVPVLDEMVITNDGTMYSLIDKNVYKWSAFDDIQRFYKNIEDEGTISLSNDAQRYAASIYNGSVSVIELETNRVLSIISNYSEPSPALQQLPQPKPSPHMDLFTVEYNTSVLVGNRYESRKNHAVWTVGGNIPAWINIAGSKNLAISHDENIIASYGRHPKTNIFETSVYKKGDFNFMLLADTKDIYIKAPFAVSEKLLITATNDDFLDKELYYTRGKRPKLAGASSLGIFIYPNFSGITVNVYNIKKQTIVSPLAYQIKFPRTERKFIEDVYSGPNNTYLFLIAEPNKVIDNIIQFIKYHISPYKLLNDFLVAKLGE